MGKMIGFIAPFFERIQLLTSAISFAGQRMAGVGWSPSILMRHERAGDP
jgi:hypothetical protein